jgi:hypothetical protein
MISIKWAVVLCAVAAVGTAASIRADDDINGVLKVSSPLQFSYKKGALITAEPGDLKTNLDMDRKGGHEQLKINIRQGALKGKQVVVNIPDGVSLPKQGGEVSFKSSEIAQPFDLGLSIKVTHTDSAPITTSEGCCPDVMGCYNSEGEPSHPGTQTVTYFLRTTLVNGDATFSSPDTGSQLARWTGERLNYPERIYTYTGPCWH